MALEGNMKRLVLELVAALREMYGENLLSVSVYGEAVSEGAAPGMPPKMLVVLGAIGTEDLGRYAGIHAKWQKKGIAPPLMMTRGDLDTSADVFPMEFLEMKDSYQLLYGYDAIAHLEVKLSNLRLQLEEQVKGKLIHLRLGYMEAGGDRKALTHLIASSVERFAEVMKNALRLIGRPAPPVKETAIREYCALAGLDGGPFIEALKVRRGGLKPAKDELDSLFSRYMAQVARLAECIDKLDGAV